MADRVARIVTPSFLLLFSCNFLGAMNFYLLTAIFTEYALNTYQLPYSTAALTVSLYVAGALAARVFLGRRIDGWGLKPSIVVGYAVLALTSYLYVIQLPFSLLVFVRFIQGVGFGVSSGAASSAAALIIPASRRGEGIGYYSMAQALATGIGPFAAILLINLTSGYRTLFVVTAAAAVVMTLMSTLVRIPDVEPAAEAAAEGAAAATPEAEGARAAAAAEEAAAAPTPAPEAEPGRPLSPVMAFIGRFAHLKVLPFGVSLLMAYVCYAGLITYLTLYAADLGFSSTASLYFIVYAIAILISRPPMGRMADRKNENAVIRLTLPALVVGMVALGAAGTFHQSLLLLVSAALCGFGIGSTQSVLQAVVPKVVPASELGLGNSTFLMMLDLGSGFAPVLLGLLVPITGYAVMYYLLAGWAVLAAAVYYLAHGRRVQ